MGGKPTLAGSSVIKVKTCLQIDRGLEGLQEGSRGLGSACSSAGSPVCANVLTRVSESISTGALRTARPSSPRKTK